MPHTPVPTPVPHPGTTCRLLEDRGAANGGGAAESDGPLGSGQLRDIRPATIRDTNRIFNSRELEVSEVRIKGVRGFTAVKRQDTECVSFGSCDCNPGSGLCLVSNSGAQRSVSAVRILTYPY